MRIVNPPETRGQFLYHYTTRETALQYILKNGTLQLSPFTRVNDPREAKDWDFLLILPEHNKLSPDQHAQLQAATSASIKNKLKLACFSNDGPESVGMSGLLKQDHRGYAKPSLWHNYANAHDGVCLMFDRVRLLQILVARFGAKRVLSGDIDYSNEWSLPTFADSPFTLDLTDVSSGEKLHRRLTEHVARWHRQLFFQKLRDWRNEDEYRFVCVGNDEKAQFVNFEDALVGLYIGAAVPAVESEQLTSEAERYRIDSATLDWKNGHPRLVNVVPRKGPR